MNQVRSALSLLLMAPLFMVGGIILRLVMWPLWYLLPPKRDRIISIFMRGMSVGIFAILRLGGARAERRGHVPNDEPMLVVMNHQSLLDVPMAVLISSYAPMFVTRRRYSRFVPSVSLSLRMLGAPLVDSNDRRGALREMKAAMLRQQHGILIFPEGHRTRDGEIQPFHTAGLQLMLRARPMPVYLLVTDGYWTCPRLVDFVFHVHKIQGRTDVLGPFQPPEDDEQLGAFVDDLRDKMVAHLRQMREDRARAL